MSITTLTRLKHIVDIGSKTDQWDVPYVVYLIKDALPQAGQEALKLWAVHVLDAYDDMTGKTSRWEPFLTNSGRGEICPNNGIRYSGKDRDDARITAADDVWKELPTAVKVELGPRPC